MHVRRFSNAGCESWMSGTNIICYFFIRNLHMYVPYVQRRDHFSKGKTNLVVAAVVVLVALL
jgi:hypothetical protein